MRTYIAYKFAGNDKEKLKEQLLTLSSKIEDCGIETYIFSRDVQKWGEVEMTPKEIIDKDFEDMKTLDMYFAFVDNDQKSEGMLLEAGFAKANGLKMVLAIRKGIDLRFLKALSDVVIEFESFGELLDKIPGALNR